MPALRLISRDFLAASGPTLGAAPLSENFLAIGGPTSGEQVTKAMAAIARIEESIPSSSRNIRFQPRVVCFGTVLFPSVARCSCVPVARVNS